MQTTAHPAQQGYTFTLTAETDADRELLDAIQSEGLHSLVLGWPHRTPNPCGPGYVNHSFTATLDRASPVALEAQTARQLLRALRELFRLGLGEDALNGHIGLDAPNPQTQDKIAAVFKQLQLVLELGAVAIGQPKAIRQEVHCTHGVSSSETTTVEQAHALLRRARGGILFSAINGAADRFHFWQGVASAAEDIANGNALRMATNDAESKRDQEQTSLETAWAILPEGVKHLTMADVQLQLAAKGIKTPDDLRTVGQQGGAA